MHKANESDKDAIISYLSEHRTDCLYMYINALFYGVNDPNIPLWLDDSNGVIHCVVMRYYNCFRIHCEDGYDKVNDIATLINSETHLLIFCNSNLREQLEPLLAASYQAEVIWFMRMSKRYREFDFSKVRLAQENDIPEIVEMLVADPFYAGQCEPDQLEKQIIDRMRNGLGCTFILRDDVGKIAATDSIMAQAGKIMIASQFLCRADMRKKFVAETIENYIIKYAVDAGKELYVPLTEDRRLRQFLATGCTLMSESCKLIRQLK